MNRIFAIGIPTINRADLLNESLQKYVVDFPDTAIFIVDNGKQEIFEHPNIITYRPPENLGVADSWNYLAQEIFDKVHSRYALIMNDDIYFGKTEKSCLAFLQEMPDEDFIVSPANWCNFFLPRKTYNLVGAFDHEFYPAYYEDNDYHYRMQLLGLSYFPSMFMSPAIYRNSMTIAKDMSLNARFDTNKQRYIAKWGGMPTEEAFTTPFNA